MPLTPRPLGSLVNFDRPPYDGSTPCTRSMNKTIAYPVETLAIHALSFQLEQTTSQRLVTDLIIQPRVDRPYFMRIQPANVIDANMTLKLFPGLSSLLKKVRPEPYLFQMRLMRILGQYLLDCHFSLGGSMHPQPNHTEPSPSQQPNPLEILRKPIPELVELIGSEVSLNIKPILLPGLLVELDSLILMILVLADIIGPFLDAL